ncbi:MAG: VCBS repeat-containing protein, partial [bacterium]
MKTLKVQNVNKRKMTSYILLLTLIFWILGSGYAFADDLEHKATLYPDPGFTYDYYWSQDYDNFRFGASIAAGDINGDGIDDIMVYNGKEGTIYIYDVCAGIGQNYVNPELIIKIYGHITAVALADVNGDDIQDIIIGSDHYRTCYAFYGSTAWLNPDRLLDFDL